MKRAPGAGRPIENRNAFTRWMIKRGLSGAAIHRELGCGSRTIYRWMHGARISAAYMRLLRGTWPDFPRPKM